MPRQEEVTAAEELADLKKIIAAERAQRAAELHAKDLQIAALQGETQGPDQSDGHGLQGGTAFGQSAGKRPRRCAMTHLQACPDTVAMHSGAGCLC